MAPLDAFFPPPSNSGDAFKVVTSSYPPYVVGPPLLQFCKSGGIAMRYDSDRGILQFVIDRLRRLEEKQIAVEIGHPLGTSFATQHEKHPSGRTSKIIFNRTTSGTCCGEL